MATVRCAKCGGALKQRADDNEQVVLERLKVYQRNTFPLVEYYGKRPTYCRIDGNKEFDDVAAALRAAVEGLRKSGGAGL
jgi:adenylate kinase